MVSQIKQVSSPLRTVVSDASYYTGPVGQVVDEMSCDDYLEKYPRMKKVDTQADIQWVETDDAVKATLTDLPGGGCGVNIIYMGRFEAENGG